MLTILLRKYISTFEYEIRLYYFECVYKFVCFPGIVTSAENARLSDEKATATLQSREDVLIDKSDLEIAGKACKNSEECSRATTTIDYRYRIDSGPVSSRFLYRLSRHIQIVGPFPCQYK